MKVGVYCSKIAQCRVPSVPVRYLVDRLRNPLTHRLVCTSIPIPRPGGTGKGRLGVGGWCQSTQNVGLSNHKLKSALTCTVWSQCTSVPDRQTDGRTEEHHGNSATIRSNARIARQKSLDIFNDLVFDL